MRRMLLAVGILLITSLPVEADFDAGLAAYKRGDYATALRELRPLAEQGDASAQRYVGYMYDNGQGVPQNDAEAVKWYRKAAEQGNAHAQHNLGYMYSHGKGVPQDYAEAAKWFRKAAEQGNATAHDKLEAMYAFGRGVPQNDVEAVKWFRRDAELGVAAAQFRLALMYDKGQGVPQNDAEAVKWYRKAAEQPDVDAYRLEEGYILTYRAAAQETVAAQYNLGVMYDNGRGVPQNCAEAVKWYRLAAEQGNASAQNNLGSMYENGQGLPQNYAEAYFWFILAAASGDELAKKGRNLVAERLSKQQIGEVQKRAASWQPRSSQASPATPPSSLPHVTSGALDLSGLTPATPPSSTYFDPFLVDAQKQLAALGFDPGPADGVVGSKTRAAIRAFQQQMGMPVTGEASEDLLERLEQEVKTAAARLSPIQPAPLAKPLTEPMIPAGLDFGRYHALVIGNVAYRSLPKLETAVNDAEAVGKLLRDVYGFSITLLKNATRTEIVEAFDDLRSRLTESDNLLVYYAGHGKIDREADRGYWLPVDAAEDSRAQWLSNATITDTLKAIRARHVMVVADSCYSGTLTRGDRRGLELVAKAPDYLGRMVKTKTRTALTSGGLEPVEDRGGGGHSVFAKALLDALGGNTGVVDGTQLFAKVREQVRLNAPQTPQYANIRFAGHEVGGDFVFVRKR